MGDFQSAASTHWMGLVAVDPIKALAELRKMTQPERAGLVTDASNHPYLERVFAAADVDTAIAITRLVPMDIRWKLYFLSRGNALTTMTPTHWHHVIGLSTPAKMEELRKYDFGFKHFINTAPADLIRPADLLAALIDGTWTTPTADRISGAIVRLSPPQRQQLRDNKDNLALVCSKMADGNAVFSLLMSLDTPVKWAIHHINTAGHIATVTQHQWQQMLMEATPAERAELKGWAEVWTITQANCPKAVLEMVEAYGKEDGAVDDIFANAMAITMAYMGMGPAAFLAAATQTNGDLAGNYTKIKAAGHVDKVIADIPEGSAMGIDTQESLKKWFMPAAGESDVPTLEKMINRRFSIDANARVASNTKHTDATTTVAAWTPAGLRRCWTVMESLPPHQVADNPSFVMLLRNGIASNGNAYAWQNDIMMGYLNDGELGQNAGAATNPIFTGQTVNTFNATLRHEIGHAVDNSMGIMDKWRGEALAGAWEKYGSYADWVDAIIAQGGGLTAATAVTHGYTVADVPSYRAAMISAVTNGTTFNVALQAVKPGATAAPDAGPISAVFKLSRWTGGGTGPWYSDTDAKPQGGRLFQRAYDSASGLWAYEWATRQAHEVTKYQWRSPGEWFAEAYQVYYAEQETGGANAVGGLLRSKDSATAEFMAQIVDQGFSPQAMTGGTTQAAPNPNG